ncbi:hypothetical protein H6783_03200 [Candidatus Nomurabacteria bacterium]|nr:hypothetical protein [Candidatus Nomurabacteria bacterium]
MLRSAVKAVVFAGLFFGVVPVYAATLYMEPQELEVYPGDTRAVAVRLDTDDGECVNVISGVITYEANVVLADIARGNSIVPIWVEEPTIDSVNHQVTFAGGIPNGYCGRIDGDPRLTNVLFELMFQAPGFSVGAGSNDGLATVAFGPETAVYLNDGFGTQAPLSALGADLLVGKRPRPQPIDDWQQRVVADELPPQSFNITLSNDKSIYGGRYFITFNTTDKQSGLDHYELIEEPLDQFDLFAWGRADAPWITGKSPYLLKDQSLNSTIRVKAVDKAGNEYVAVLVPSEELRGYSERDFVSAGLFIAGGIIILVSLFALFYYRRTLKRLQAEEIKNE